MCRQKLFLREVIHGFSEWLAIQRGGLDVNVFRAVVFGNDGECAAMIFVADPDE